MKIQLMYHVAILENSRAKRSKDTGKKVDGIMFEIRASPSY